MNVKRILLVVTIILLICTTASAEKVIIVMKNTPKTENLQTLKSLVLRKQEGIMSQIMELKKEGKVKSCKQLWIINAIAIDASKDVIKQIEMRKDVAKVVPDYPVKLFDVNGKTKLRLFKVLQEIKEQKTKYIEVSQPAHEIPWNIKWIEADKVWKYGINGSGVKVAVVDTGIFPHPDLANKIIAWKDFVNNITEPYDDNGHGTHVAGIIAGNKTGVAPGVKLIGVKVFNKFGWTNVSTLIAGFQWAAEHGADVISYSGGAIPMYPLSNSSTISPNESLEVRIPVYPYIFEEAYKPAFIFLAVWSPDIKDLGIKMLNPDNVSVNGIEANWLESCPETYNEFRAIKYYSSNGTTPLKTGNWTLQIFSLKKSTNHVWYSGSGDDLNNTLSINLDLTNVTKATLTFDTRYDMEYDFDFGYVQVVCNNTTYTLATYTGTSDWHRESINLTKFVGKNITLIFRYVTDYSVSYPGWYIDNISIPEIGFYDNVENGNIGWNASGWRIVVEGIPVYYEVLVVYPSDGTSILDNATNNIVANGTVVVVAAGNEGELGLRTIDSPASASGAIAVGATGYMEDYIAWFSSRGPVGWGINEKIKPDVVAPGVGIYSTWLDGDYEILSGTSMATPHVSGVIALMLQANSSLTPQEIKEILMKTSVDLGKVGKDNTYGAGRISAWNAVSNVTNLEEKEYSVKLFAGITKPPGWYCNVGTTVTISAISWKGKPLSGVNVSFLVTRNYDVVINETKVTNSLGFANISFVANEEGYYQIVVRDEYNNEVTQYLFVINTSKPKPPLETIYRSYTTTVNGTVHMEFPVLTDLKPFNGTITLEIYGNGEYNNGIFTDWSKVLEVNLTSVNGIVSYNLNLSNMSFDDGVDWWWGSIELSNGTYSTYAGDLYIDDNPVDIVLKPYYVKAKPGENTTFVLHAYNYVNNKPAQDASYTVKVYWLNEVSVKSIYEKGLLKDLLEGNKAKISSFIRNIEVNCTEFNITTTNGIALFNIGVPSNAYVGFVEVYNYGSCCPISTAEIIVDTSPWTWHKTAPSEGKLELFAYWKSVDGKPSNKIEVYVHLRNGNGTPIANATIYLYSWNGAKAVVTDESGNAFAIFNTSYNESLSPWDNSFEIVGIYEDLWSTTFVYPPKQMYWSDVEANVSNGNLSITVTHYSNTGISKIPSVIEVDKLAGWDSSSTVYANYINVTSFSKELNVNYGIYIITDWLLGDEGMIPYENTVGYTPLKLSNSIPKFSLVNTTVFLNVHIDNGSNAVVYVGAVGYNYSSCCECYCFEMVPVISTYSYFYATRADENGNATLKVVTPSRPMMVHYFVGFATSDFSSPNAVSGYFITTTVPKPDLTVRVIAPKVMEVGKTYNVSVIVSNIGTKVSNETTVNLYIDNNLVQTFNVPSLSPGSEAKFTYNWLAIEGKHTIKSVVDPNNFNDELNEGNNVCTVNVTVVKYYSISGRIYYNGSLNGVIHILALTNDTGRIVSCTTVDYPSIYTLYLPNGSYHIFAYMDVNGNGAFNSWEPSGFAINKTNMQDADTITVNGNSISNADITLVLHGAIVSVGSAVGWGNVTIPVFVANVVNLTGMNFTLNFNPMKAKVLSVDSNYRMNYQYINNTNGYVKVALVFDSPLTTNERTPVARITFNVNESTYLNLTNVELCNESFTPFKPAAILNGSIEVGVKGDFNGNGRVDIGDVAYVAYMVLGKVPKNSKADFNGNGRVDIGDLAKIAYYYIGKIHEL